MRSALLVGFLLALAFVFRLTEVMARERPTDSAVASEMSMTTETTADLQGRNRLGAETSPYLRQHRDNPVHWRPWGAEAFAEARTLDKPIFLSVGYSTCYWCHVMERESFENDDVAAIMNEHFVCIKVDREERPDVDDIYMTSVQLLTGSGGWPMSVFLEPRALKPFLGGTYFPPEDRSGRPGFKSVLRQVARLWAEQREAVLRQAEQVGEAVARRFDLAARPGPVGSEPIDAAVAALLGRFDREHGGFGQTAPKFPTPANIDFLIAAAWDRTPVREALTFTLDRMAMGGMYDQIGGGFHRYSVDERWLVPHFEKMLYDNAQLASTYAEAYARTGDPSYARIVRETLEYVLREMTSPEGGFYSAQDAEVNHREGGSYLWVPDEIRDALTDAGLDEDLAFALDVYGLTRGANFRDPHHPGDGGKNVLYLVEKPVDRAANMGITAAAFHRRLERVNAALLQARTRREQPATDDKILAGWNGLMIAGMADGGRVLGETRYLDAARRAAQYVLRSMRTPDGALLRSSRGGQARIPAFLEDYAYITRGLLALHRATGGDDLLADAVDLMAATRTRFWDEANGGYYDTLPDQHDLFVRVKSVYDGATPCGNAVMLNNLLTLHERTGDQRFLDDALATMQSLSTVLAARPTGSATSLRALVRLAGARPGLLADPAPRSNETDDPVRVAAEPNVLALAPGREAILRVKLHIARGFHITAREAGLESLVPLDVRVVGGDGIRMAPAYPEGTAFDGPLGTMYVHEGEVTIPIRVERIGDITGAENVMLTYQACTAAACLPPQTRALPVEFVGEQ